ncbi:MAG TPA: carbohydrate kinase [Candidatus Melainabacteria bacterium]|nr:carbohydrate kinase [Candidatus Melainabacteria bacterium]
MADVLCLGEILVDWVSTQVGKELDEAATFTKAAGGAPANTAVGLARQGVATGFIGRVSDDEFGRWLKGVLEKDGINTSLTVSDPEAQTRMAYVVTTASGDRKLAEFTKVACADVRLHEKDLQPEEFARAKVLHFGSISLIASPAREATEKAVKISRENNMVVSYDPNVRLGLWPSAQACKDAILSTLKWADIVKINEDELEFLTGSRDLEKAEELRKAHELPVLIITLDSRGAYVSNKEGGKIVPGFKVKLVEATGAGDGFNSGVITGLMPLITDEERLKKASGKRRQLIEQIDLSTLSQIVARANAIGAITCTRAGAIPALPTTAEIDAFLAEMTANTPA